MSWIDILVLFIFGFYIVLDLKRGLVQSLASVLSFIASLVVASALYKTVYAFVLVNTGIYEWLHRAIASHFASQDASGGVLPLELDKLPDAVQRVLESLLQESGASALGLDLVRSLTDMILYALCFLAVFLVVRIFIFLLAGMLDFVAKLPGLNIMNKLGGLLIGVVEGAIISLVLVNLVYTLSILFKMESVINALNNSSIAQYFYIGYFFV